MPGVTDEQIAAARSVDLLSYLQAKEPGSIRKSGPGEYRMIEHDSLKISNGKWYRHSRSYGSNSLVNGAYLPVEILPQQNSTACPLTKKVK